MFVVVDGCDFGVVCYCCWNRFGLATVIFVLKTFSQIFDKVIKQWFRIVVCVCSTKSARCLMEAEHSCSIVAVSIPFLLLKLERLRFLFMTFPIFIFCCALELKRRVKIPWDGWHLNLFVKFTNLCCEMDTDCPQRVHCCLPSCWSAGSGFWKESSVTCALKLYVQCVLLV